MTRVLGWRHHGRRSGEINVNVLRPVRPGRLVGKGKVVRRDGDLASLEGSLFDGQGAP